MRRGTESRRIDVAGGGDFHGFGSGQEIKILRRPETRRTAAIASLKVGWDLLYQAAG